MVSSFKTTFYCNAKPGKCNTYDIDLYQSEKVNILILTPKKTKRFSILSLDLILEVFVTNLFSRPETKTGLRERWEFERALWHRHKLPCVDGEKKTQSRHHSLSHCLLVFMIRKASGRERERESRDTVLVKHCRSLYKQNINIHRFKTNNHLQLTGQQHVFNTATIFQLLWH